MAPHSTQSLALVVTAWSLPSSSSSSKHLEHPTDQGRENPPPPSRRWAEPAQQGQWLGVQWDPVVFPPSLDKMHGRGGGQLSRLQRPLGDCLLTPSPNACHHTLREGWQSADPSAGRKGRGLFLLYLGMEPGSQPQLLASPDKGGARRRLSLCARQLWP